MTLEQRLTDLGDLLVALLSSPVPSDQFQYLADNAQKVIPCDFLAICLLDPDSDSEGMTYRVHSLLGFAGGAIPRRPFKKGEGIVSHVIDSMKPYQTDDLAEDEFSSPDLEGVIGRLGISKGLVVPLLQDSRSLGALLFAAQPATVYDGKDLEIAEKLANGLSGALDNSRIYQMLADDRSTLEAVLRSTEDAILLVNVQGRVLMANPAVRAMFGLNEVELIGRSLQNAVNNRDLIRLFTSGEPGIVEVPLADGRITQARLSPVGTSYGEQIGWAAVFRDISVLKELEQMKNDFVNTVSHDLKNPISSILLAADLLKRLGPLEETQVQMHGRIVETANYMNELVSDLLDLGRISAGLDMDKDPVDMVQLIESVLESLKVQVEEKEHEIILTMPGSAFIQGDMGRLKQVLLNLIGNAIKYTPERGEIMVSVTLAGSDGRDSNIQPDKDLVEAGVADEESLVVVRVQDNGYGIPAADVPLVFDRFFRVQTDETFNIKGTGLGLAIAKSIIEAHDGRIWVDSEEGKGSTFAFYIPH